MATAHRRRGELAAALRLVLRSWSLLCCCCLFLLLPLALAAGGDYEILLRVKAAHLEDPDGQLDDWAPNADRSPCNWTGVTCETRNRSVVAIDLSGLNLSGGFPYDFCRIRTLRNLSLGFNFFNGTVAGPSLSLCSHLQGLNISSNIFVGELPDLSPGFPDLRFLDLSLNNFSGEIPASFGRLPALSVLSLVANLLNGSIPSFLGNLSQLTQLNISYNPFVPGPLPPEIGNLSRLENLWAAGSYLVGESRAQSGSSLL